jgi:hypothetical protein
MIQSHKTAVAIFGIQIRPIARQNVGVQIDFHRLEL